MRWTWPRLAYDTPWLMLPAILIVTGTFVLPLGVILYYSLHQSVWGSLVPGVSAANYTRIFSDGAYYRTLFNSMVFVSALSLLIVAVAFPFAYFVAVHVSARRRTLAIVLTAIPFLTSYLAKVIAWLNLLGEKGILNSALMSMHLISQPLAFLSRGKPAIVLTFVYLLVPLAFLTLYSALDRIDPNLFEAASDLGARGRHILLRVVLPAARNGILGGFALVYITMFGDYITPVTIGGTDGVLFVNLLVNQFGASMQWGFGAAMAVTMLVTTVVLLGTLKRLSGRMRPSEFTRRSVKPARWPLKLYAAAFLLFLYAPLFLLLLFALNSSGLVGLPLTGLTLKWYWVALSDPNFRSSLQLSFEVALASAVISTACGTMAAIPIARRTGLVRNGALLLLSAPMLMPPVVLGTGILISCNALGVLRGLWTLIAGHTLLSLPVALLVVLSRLEGMDSNQEFAAMDLGATPWRVLARVTLPQAAPALISALLLTFAFSLDEFILTFLITGRDTTLPLYIYSSIRFQLSPSVIAGASIVLLLSIVLIALGGLAYSVRVTAADHAACGKGRPVSRALECIDIRKRYGTLPYSLGRADRGIDLAVGSGELFAIIGPSGCGKSTLLRIIGGFVPPTSGRIAIGGRDVSALPPHARPTNTVFQNYALFPHLTIGRNVSFGLEMEKVPSAERNTRVAAALDLVGLTGFADRHVGELSGGQLQRAALARALVKRPAVLLLDEPLGALDLKLRRQMQDEIVQLKMALGMTIVHVTHDQEEACAMADRIAVLNAGVVLQVASPIELYRAPRTTFVADFIHAGTIVRGGVSADGRAMRLDRPGLSLAGHSEPMASAGPVAALLPRHGAGIRRAAPGEEAGVNAVRATLSRLAFVGTDFAAQLRLRDGFVIALQLPLHLVAELGLEVGVEVIATWRPEQLRLIEDDLPAAAQVAAA